MSEMKCKYYKPKDKEATAHCPNCYRWIGIQCIDHLELVKGHETGRKFRELERLMRERKAVEGPM